jgi:hypothetical protein
VLSCEQEASDIGDQREWQRTAVFIGVRARSDHARQVHLVVKKRVNGYENRCKARFMVLDHIFE